MTTRRQATMYLPSALAEFVESIRARFNPQQAALIRAHVTLCREDEVDDWAAFAIQLRRIGSIDVRLEFDRLVRDRDLVYVAPSGDTGTFDALRAALLARAGVTPRQHAPHITLIHPRNGHCSDADFVTINAAFAPFTVRFDEVTLIEQMHGGSWRDVAGFPSTDTQSA